MPCIDIRAGTLGRQETNVAIPARSTARSLLPLEFARGSLDRLNSETQRTVNYIDDAEIEFAPWSRRYASNVGHSHC